MLQQYTGTSLPNDELEIISNSIMDWGVLGERCISQKHDQIISNQKAGIASLRDRIATLEETSASANIPSFALQRISTLKKANEALEAKAASEILAAKKRFLDVADQKLYDEISRLTELLESNKAKLNEEKVSRRQNQEDLHDSEEIYFKCIRDINSELSIKHMFGHVPFTDGISRSEVMKERNKGVEVILNSIKNLKSRIQRQEALLGNYDTDMKNFRELEAKFDKMSYHVKYLESELEEKTDEISYLQEALRKSRNECADLKRLNTSIKLNKKFSMDYKK